MSSPRTRPRRPLSRREFVRRLAALSAGAWATPHLTGTALRNAWAQTTATAMFPAGTTLERTITTVGGEGPYFALTYGPAWPIEVRTDLAQPRAGREDRRVPLVAFLHVTDYQLQDSQSPARVEFLDRQADPPNDQIEVEGYGPGDVSAAFRPQEALVCHAVESLMRRARELRRGPVTGRPVDFTMATGDNIDNIQANELRWFMTLHDGGELTPNSGAGDQFEGVQTFNAPEFYDPHYWHPDPVEDPRGPDQYKSLYGFPDYPGLLAAAISPISAIGLATPWYTAYGNHDGLVQGNVERNELFNQIALGSAKVLGPPPGTTTQDLLSALESGDADMVALAPARPVTADPERRLITPREYIRAHLDSPAAPGPVGHGFTEDNFDAGTLYYTFEVAPGIRGITLNTTSPVSSEGSIQQAQLDWLEQRLIEVHARYHDSGGNEVRTTNDDQLVMLFSHHRPASMPLPSGSGSTGYFGGDAVLEVLHRFPNVVVWVNGHSHFNRVVAQADPAGRTGGFWDITTSAQIDPPQQARILELVDNRDGTLSLFSTIIDHAADPGTAVGAYDLLGLASISRELSFNDYQANAAGAIGEPTDRNVELLLAAPFPVSPEPPPAEEPTPEPEPQPPLPATGAGVGAAAIGAAVAGAVALRHRRPTDDPGR